MIARSIDAIMAPDLLPYLIMPIGGLFIGLMCWLFLFPKSEDLDRGR